MGDEMSNYPSQTDYLEGHIEALEKQLEELKAKLRNISTIANYGGLIGLSEIDAMRCIRKITIHYMPKSEKELKWSEIQIGEQQ
jgi:hypothetical protein